VVVPTLIGTQIQVQRNSLFIEHNRGAEERREEVKKSRDA